MPPAASRQYPGESANPEQILCLAEEYKKAALLLVQHGRRRAPLTWAPCRLSAIHAIELFLNALLLHKGHAPSTIRSMQHDLAERARRAEANGLQLRKRTSAHLSVIVGNREYVVTRYGAEMTGSESQINRLTATLDEVANKVEAIMKNSR